MPTLGRQSASSSCHPSASAPPSATYEWLLWPTPRSLFDIGYSSVCTTIINGPSRILALAQYRALRCLRIDKVRAHSSLRTFVKSPSVGPPRILFLNNALCQRHRSPSLRQVFGRLHLRKCSDASGASFHVKDVNELNSGKASLVPIAGEPAKHATKSPRVHGDPSAR